MVIMKNVTVASPIESKNNDEKKSLSKLNSSDRPLQSPSQGKSVVHKDNSLQNRQGEIPVSPLNNAVSPSNNPVTREISPDMLFQLASKLTGGTFQLPSLSQLPNALYNASLVAPPGFVTNTKVNDLPIARTIPQTISHVVGDPNRQIPNCLGKQQVLQQPDIHQMHTPTKPVQIPQQSQISSPFPSQQQSPHVQQNSMALRHTQQIPQQQQSPQHQVTQNTTLQYPNMHHLQLHTSQPQTTQYQNPSVPINTDLLSRLLARPSQGISSQVGPSVMRPNFGGGFPPPGITLGHINYSQAVQLQPNSLPVSGSQTQQQQQQQRALSAMQFSQLQQLHSANRDINVNTTNGGNLVHRTVNTAPSPPASSLPPFQNHIYDHPFMASGKQGTTINSGSSSPSQVLRPYSNTNVFGSGQMDPA
ncbi:hypothetical protein Anas_10074 [Armadillidium nasatum]|uniref:Uncharacterized protein n=1 Tax=Armadillidium nasatum TaxID=96803 RepID=A0A5N5TJ21_9CRUS|nr:hypothetical protein Anas_10074 [Armadillidium nasatum]